MRRSRAWAAWTVAVLLGCAGNVLALLGCAGNVVVSEELPDAPIAFVYRTLEQGRERADALGGQRPSTNTSRIGQGVMNLNEADDYLARLRGQDPRRARRHDGRVALLHPRSGRLEVLDSLLPGALPMDWSPSRDRLLFTSRRHGNARLYEYRFESRVLTGLMSGHEDHLQGSYGPDGRVAYVEMRRLADQQVDLSIWATRIGGRPERLTDGPADLGPAWSSDGRWLLFENADDRGRRTILSRDLREPDGEARVIARGADPVISPVGDWVVYARKGRDGWRLWRMRPDGSGKSALGARSQGQADERAPTISPDGRYVAYVAEEDLRQRLRVRRMDGTGDRPLFEDGDGSLPAW